jgi:hypothetical protein
MEKSMSNWERISFALESPQDALKFREAFDEIFMRLNAPYNMALFSRYDIEKSQIDYFFPRRSNECRTIDRCI